jgi:hypothetical protein
MRVRRSRNCSAPPDTVDQGIHHHRAVLHRHQCEELPAVRVIAPPSPAVLAHIALGRTSVFSDAKSADWGAGVSELDANLAIRVAAVWPLNVVFLFLCLW